MMKIQTLNNSTHSVNSDDELHEFQPRPSLVLIDDFAKVEGDITVTRIEGKMDSTLARLTKPASLRKNTMVVARYSERELATTLNQWAVSPDNRFLPASKKSFDQR